MLRGQKNCYFSAVLVGIAFFLSLASHFGGELERREKEVVGVRMI